MSPAIAPDSRRARSRVASLIGAPTDVGASDRGASMGPEALRVAGLHAALTARGLKVVDCGNVGGPPNPGLQRVDGYRNLRGSCGLEPGAAYRGVPGAASLEAAHPSGWRSQPLDRLRVGGRTALPRNGSSAAGALARCPRRLQHARIESEREPARHAGGVSVRLRSARAPARWRIARDSAAVGPAGRHSQRRSRRTAIRPRPGAAGVRHAIHR